MVLRQSVCWANSDGAPQILLESGGAVILIALGSEGALVWHPISLVGTGSILAGIQTAED